MMLKKSTKNSSGFDRVRKHGKKWQPWTFVDGKQIFLADQDDPEEAAKELWKFENKDKPTHSSPSPGHRKMAKRAPLATAPPPLTKMLTRCARIMCSTGMRMIKPSPRSPLAAATANKTEEFKLAKLADTPDSWRDEGDETFVKDRYYPMVYAAELLVPLPGLLFAAVKHIK